MQPRSYAILGTGAVGGFYGARLQRAGFEVHFLLHSDYEHVRRHGLVIESKEGDFTLPQVHAYRKAGAMPKCDVAVVALKATQNDLLPELLPPVVKPDGAVLIMQNGLGAEEAVTRIVGPVPVLGGLCFLCSNKIGPGHIGHLDYGFVTLGEHDPNGQSRGVTEPMRQIGSDLERAGIRVHLADDLAEARWRKLVWNIPYNGLSVVLNANTDELMRDPATRELVEELMIEVIESSRACGSPVPPDFIGEMLAKTEQMVPYRTSMKIDYDERRPMEIEAIYGNPWRAAQKAGYIAPRLGALYCQLQFLDARRRRLPQNA